MTRPDLSVVVRGLWPRRVRTRLAVTYAVLFLLAGTVLLALTYALLVIVLVPAPAIAPKQLPPHIQQLVGICKPPPTSAALVAECKRAIAATGGDGPKVRGDILSSLWWASVIGLGILMIISVGLGWLVSARGAARAVDHRGRQAGFRAAAWSATCAHGPR